MSKFDLDTLKALRGSESRYNAQLTRLRESGIDVSCIEQAVAGAIANISENASSSFVIFGEPQSGKTEMMICLTARLLDLSHDLIIHLLNDSVQLLEQNLDRFKRSRLAPAARNFSEILDPDISLKGGKHVIFAKKNAKDLDKLLEKTHRIRRKVIIDDEADYASPNSKINRGEVTRINNLIGQLISDDGIYIGVTATPARLDLNNTFDNDNEKWVRFPAHQNYTGQEDFFPLEKKLAYRLNLLSDTQDEPRFIRESVFRFLITVAYINLFENSAEENYSMLIHTSGKREDHSTDRKTIEKIFQDLIDENSRNFASYLRQMYDQAENLFPVADAQKILSYIVTNVSRFTIIVMNSDRDKGTDFTAATNPAALYTIVIGGNIVSRGVTFQNLLSMFFTRSTKTKLQQDTYIQRARMFGSRGRYLEHFELTIPQSLYTDWHRCFVFHKLALASIVQGRGSPIWIADKRISVASGTSIERARVQFDKGEMLFALFKFDPFLDQIADDKKMRPLDKLKEIQKLVGEAAVPEYLLDYVSRIAPTGTDSIALHASQSIANYKDADQVHIDRVKGFMGTNQLKKFPKAVHHFQIFRNARGDARLLYKFQGSLQFIKNLKNGR
ncbi:MAG: DNA helicase [Alphaproteobacteria bacterium HGW-Alphaproteobacteria-3]|nr:MAG: DNA helicase [Alphaproteobacteria bacterium HGW-Alphaproteobacteria-3]